MGRTPKKPEAPKTPNADTPAVTDNAGGTVRRRGRKKPDPVAADSKMSEAVTALKLMSEVDATGDMTAKSIRKAVETYGEDALRGALKGVGMDMDAFKWKPDQTASTPTNVVSENTVTTGSVVPVTSADGSLAPVSGQTAAPTPTSEQAAALKALGLSGNKSAAPPPPPNNPPSIKEMIKMIRRFMAENPYTPPAPPGPPVLSQVRTVDPKDVAAQPTVQLRTGEVEPKPQTPAFAFPPGFSPGAEDGRVQMDLPDYTNLRPVVAQPLSTVQYEIKPGGMPAEAKQLSKKTEPDAPSPFADIPLDPNKGFVGMYRNRKNLLNSPKALAGATLGLGVGAPLTYMGIRALANMMSGGSEQPVNAQDQEAQNQAILNSHKAGGFR